MRATVGMRLKQAREYLAISQQNAAKTLGVPRSAISLIESGRRRVDSVELSKLAKLYQRSVAYFIGDSEQLPVDPDIATMNRKFAKLSADDRSQVIDFINYLMSKRSGGMR